jgi:hypothetical protein
MFFPTASGAKSYDRLDSVKIRYVMYVLGVLPVLIVGTSIYFYLYGSSTASNVPFNLVSFDSYCYPFTLTEEEFQSFPNQQKISPTFVINDNQQYQQLLQYRRYASQACSQVPLPTIDFSKYTLLGQFTSGDCGTTDFTRTLFRNDALKSYAFTVSPVNSVFTCSSGPPGASMNWIITPKIPSDYQVFFKG